jgi:hypothetical protein
MRKFAQSKHLGMFINLSNSLSHMVLGEETTVSPGERKEKGEKDCKTMNRYPFFPYFIARALFLALLSLM